MKSLIIFLLFTTVSFSQIEYDKKAHFVAGAWTSTLTYAVVYNETKDKLKSSIYSLASGVLIGTAKEVYDSQQPNNKFDAKDLMATVLGSLTVTFIFTLL